MSRAFWFLLAWLPGFARASPPPRFVHLTSEDGLSQNTVDAILQDHVGFLWIGTEEGLNRYDGYHFVAYRHDPRSAASLPDDVVTALFEDDRHQLWVGTERGLARFDRYSGTFLPIGAIRDRVTSITQTGDGTLWVGSEGGGLFLLPRGSDRFASYEPDPRFPWDSLSSFVVSAVFRDHRGRLWVGTRNAGVDLFVPGQPFGHFVHHRHVPSDPGSLSQDEVWGLAEDKSGRIWVATNGGGLNVLDEGSGKFIHYRAGAKTGRILPSDQITTVFTDRSGTLWAGSDGAGLLRYDSDADRFTAFTNRPSEPESLSRNVIRSLAQDSQGQLWIGTFNGGIDVLRAPSHDFGWFGADGTDRGLSDPAVSCFLPDRRGGIWVGTEGGWLNRFEPGPGTFARTRSPAGAPLLSLCEDAQGRVWAGIYRGGLALFDPARGKFTQFTHREGDPTTLANDEVWAIARGADGNLWVGTNAGVDRFDPDRRIVTGHFRTLTVGGMSDSGVRALQFDREGNLWAATFGGLARLGPGAAAFEQFRHDDDAQSSISSNAVISLLVDSQDRIWAGTLGGGLNLTDPKIQGFRLYRDFPSTVINAIAEDQSGKIWVSTNHGLARLDPANGAVTAYDFSNGLESLQFKLGAGMSTREGRLFFGSTGGFCSFDPAAITPDAFAPPVFLTGMQVFGQPAQLPGDVAALSGAVLKPADKVFSVEFAALDFTFPRRNRYRYRLGGFSDRWVDLGAQHAVTFTNLDSGRYEFAVRATNADGIWHDRSTTSFAITIPPPYWRAWWFRAAGAAGIALALVGGDRLRVRRLKAKLAERKSAEDILRAAEEKYRELVEDIGDIIFATDAAGVVRYISPVLEPALGYRPAEIVGRPLSELCGAPALAALLAKLRNHAVAPIEPLEHAVQTKTGQTRWMRLSARPIFAEGRLEGMRGVIADITERKDLEVQLRQSQKMEAIGQLAGGIAHDFNNLLTVITGNCELLDLGPPLAEKTRACLDEIGGAAKRASALTAQLLAFSRKQPVQASTIDLNEVIENMRMLLVRLIGEDLHLAISLDSSPALIKADQGQIEQVLLNLTINARDAMPRGGRLAIETAMADLKENDARLHMGLRPGKYIRLAVSDTGSGMPPEVLAHLFEPFFTTKGVGKGTGLGLSTVYGIVKQSGSHIEVSSEEGRGTAFRILIPRVSPIEASPQPVPLPHRPHRPIGTVLLVEDNESVARVARQLLEQPGDTVLSASSAEDALLACARHSGSIDLLLTDMVMPGMNGRELAEQLAPRFPRMKVIFMSGYTDEAIGRHGGRKGGIAFLEKPFTRESLFQKVDEVLAT